MACTFNDGNDKETGSAATAVGAVDAMGRLAAEVVGVAAGADVAEAEVDGEGMSECAEETAVVSTGTAKFVGVRRSWCNWVTATITSTSPSTTAAAESAVRRLMNTPAGEDRGCHSPRGRSCGIFVTAELVLASGCATPSEADATNHQ